MIAQLQPSITNPQLEVEPLNSNPVSENPSGRTYAQALSADRPGPTKPNLKPSPTSSNYERKFNIVVHGINEATKGSNRYARTLHDNSEVAAIISGIDSDITSNSIRDCIRLGRYTEDKTRPLFVKLTRVNNVASILSNRRAMPQPSDIRIQPDLNPHDRKILAILLKTRWQLIHSGVDSKKIKIKGNTIMVNGALHGTTDGQIFTKAIPDDDLSDNDSPLNGIETTQPDHLTDVPSDHIPRAPSPSSNIRPNQV